MSVTAKQGTNREASTKRHTKSRFCSGEDVTSRWRDYCPVPYEYRGLRRLVGSTRQGVHGRVRMKTVPVDPPVL